MVGFKHLTVLCTALLPWTLAAPMQGAESADAAFDPDLQTEGRYIITLKEGLDSRDLESHVDWVGGVQARSLNRRDFKGVQVKYAMKRFHAYAGQFDAATIEAIRNSPEVDSVEPDLIWTISALETQASAPWGLSTMSHRSSGAKEYVYDASAGTGMFAYVVDTGINQEHVDLAGRVELGANVLPKANKTAPFKDQVGHGTHVAGTIGGTKYGVAKNVQLVAVKIFADKMQTLTSTALDGFLWSVEDIKQKKRQGHSVINLSVGGPSSKAFNEAVEAAYTEGILTVAAAGNDQVNVARVSPASAPNAITVGAIDSSWRIASYSNFGALVDIFAPGTDILSAWIGNSTASRTISGTSMAAPHISGLVSYIQSVYKLTDPAAVVKKLKELGTSGKIQRVRNGSPNLIGFNGGSTS